MSESARHRIHLVCCIGCSREEHFARPFLRHFVHHYLGLGIAPQNFHLTLHAPHKGEDIEWAEHFLDQFGIRPAGYILKDYDCYDFYGRNFELTRELPENDWIVMVDFDELIEFPRALPDYTREIEAAGCNAVFGRLVDRFAPNFQLAQIEEGPPIWDQFPIQTDFTKNGVQGFDGKVCLFCNYIDVNLGHHAVTGSRGPELKFSHRQLKVHHFKWDATLVPKLLKRREQFKSDPERYPWHAEPDRILELVNDGRMEFRK